MSDIGTLSLAERQRDEALHFLGHDARKASATILGMLELAREKPSAFPAGSLLAAIAQEARADLERCDRFVADARAETRPLRAEPLDLRATLQLVVDACWTAARERQVVVRCAQAPSEAPAMADRGLLTRALGEMLDLALAHAVAGSTLRCGVAPDGSQGWRIWFEAPPAGAAAALQSRRIRSVAQRHGGGLENSACAEGGSMTIALLLPCDLPTEP